MKKKIKVAILFGGSSAEHEISIKSAKNIYNAIDKKKYDVVLIGIGKNGHWYLNKDSIFFSNSSNHNLIQINSSNKEVAFIPGEKSNQLIDISNNKTLSKIDIVFPVLHGTFGEDGTIQGLFKLLNIPFVGADVLGSALSMDKGVMKRLLRDASIPIPNFLVFDWTFSESIKFNEVKAILSLPFFVKPANLGSSVGISKVCDKDKFKKAVKDAFEYDNKIIIEEYIKGREIECSVLGNEKPIASIPGEIIPNDEFYSYNAKYVDEDGANLEIPAELPEATVKKIQDLAIKSFKVLCCEGMARVDFFLNENKKVIVNELNTIPGFTDISMYPKLWKESGISTKELIDRLIKLAFERFEREKKLKRSYDV